MIANQNMPGPTDPKVFLYLRVSTIDQNIESQRFALLDYCARQGLANYEMFIDHGVSGAKESRPALNELMARVERNECSQVIVFSFSRFARSVSHLLKALQKFKERNIRFNSITEQLDTNSPMGLALFTILGALAQMEREIIRNRVIAGLQNAKAKGKHIGRVRKRNSALIESLLEAGLSYREISRIARCSHGSVGAQRKEWLARKATEKKKREEEEQTRIRDKATLISSEVDAKIDVANVVSGQVPEVQAELTTSAT